MATKKCSKCGEVLPLSAFGKHRRNIDGLRSRCRMCNNTAAKQWYAANTEKAKTTGARWAKKNRVQSNAIKARWQAAHPENNRAKKRRWRIRYPVKAAAQRNRWKHAHPKKHRACIRDWELRAKYDITTADYERLLVAQDNKCAICGCIPRKRRLSVDHDHDTGEVRGLLCGKCNTALGMLNDKLELCRAAVAYLETAHNDKRSTPCASDAS